MPSDRLLAIAFACASAASAVAAWAVRSHENVFWIAVFAAVLLALNAMVIGLRSRYTGPDKTKISVVTVSKAPFEHEPPVRGKSPPPGQ